MDISIVIATYRRPELLADCLESVLSQEYPSGQYEVIVVSDGPCDEGSRRVLESRALRYPHLRYFELGSARGPAAARNFGLAQARGDVVAFTDDDCVAEKSWIGRLMETYRNDPQIHVVGGATLVDPRALYVLVGQVLSNNAIHLVAPEGLEMIFFPTCNFSAKRKVLEEEKFNEAFPLPAGEDMEFCWRLRKKGLLFFWNQEARVFHKRPNTLRSFLRQAYLYGRGNYLVQFLHKDHPFFKEIKTKNSLIFLAASFVNLLKVGRFAFFMTLSFLKDPLGMGVSRLDRCAVFGLFALHKIFYVAGNIHEHFFGSADKQPLLEFESRPEFLILDLTHRCNLSCHICEIRKDKPIVELNTLEVLDLIEQARVWGVPEFVLSGGEPLLREDIWDIFQFVRGKGYRIGVLTNGLILQGDFLKRVEPYLCDGVVSLSVSLDSLTPAIHDDIRGQNGSWEKTKDALEALSRLKRRFGKVNFNVISVVLNQNFSEMPDLARFILSLGADSLQFQPLLVNNLMMNDRKMPTRFWIHADRWGLLDQVLRELIDFAKDHPGFVRNSARHLCLMGLYYRGELSKEDVRCFALEKTVLIANTGHLTTCFGEYGDIRAQKLKDACFTMEARRARDRVKNCSSPCLLPCFTDYEPVG